jgi:hypothetical protein
MPPPQPEPDDPSGLAWIPFSLAAATTRRRVGDTQRVQRGLVDSVSVRCEEYLLGVRMSSAALHPVAGLDRARVMLDLGGRRVALSRGQAKLLRDRMAEVAGRSSVARDVSLLLDRALTCERVLVLRRNEARALTETAIQLGMADLVAQLVPTAA